MDVEESIDPDPDSRGIPPAKPNKPNNWLLILLGFVSLTCIAIFFCAAITILFKAVILNEQVISNPFETARSQPTGDNIKNTIAFAGNDHNIWLVSPSGEELRHLTLNGSIQRRYRFPTWAPDNSKLAFIGPNENNTPSLYISSLKTLSPTLIYNVPNSAPFYLYWSPNSQEISFLTQEENAGLSMRLITVAAPNSERIMEQGSPFYWAWSPGGDKVLMHVGGSGRFSNQAHLSILDNRPNANRMELQISPGRFQAPLWSSDGEYIYYVSFNDNLESIYRAHTSDLAQQALTPLNDTGATYISLSPDNQYMAYLQTQGRQAIPYGNVYLMDADGKNKRKLTDRPVLSFYWSPDSAKLALLVASRNNNEPTVKHPGLSSPNGQRLQFEWWIYNLEQDSLSLLFPFSPTPDFLQLAPYFDQYQLSLTFWSPDSRYFVVTNQPSGTTDGEVWVVDSAGQELPRHIGGGTLAVWSWK